MFFRSESPVIALAWTVCGLYLGRCNWGDQALDLRARLWRALFLCLLGFLVPLHQPRVVIAPVRWSDSWREDRGDLKESPTMSQGLENYAKNEFPDFSFFASFKGYLDIGSLVLLPSQRCVRGYPEMGSQGTGPRLIVGERLYR